VKRIAVFVATTGGPARIERITREHAAQSMVCLKRTSTVLPISGAYDDFVRPGSGVIEREFGPFDEGAFRLDVSDPIGAGESWQLGFFVAHAVAASDARLAGPDDDPDMVAWLTGRVDYDLDVGSVGHLAEKLHASQEMFARWAAAGIPTTVFVHAGADREAVAAADLPDGIRVVPIRAAREALEALGIAVAGQPAASYPRERDTSESPAPRIRHRVAWISVGAVIAIATTVALTGNSWRSLFVAPAGDRAERAGADLPAQVAQTAATPAPKPPDPGKAGEASTMETPIATVLERRPPTGKTCADVQFGGVAAVVTPVAVAGGEAQSSAIAGLCGFAIEVDNGPRERFAYVAIEMVSGRMLSGTLKPPEFEGTTAFSGKRSWLLDLPRRLAEPFEYRLVVVAGPRPPGEDARRLAGAGGGAGRDAALAALSGQGFSVATTRHRVAPW
jgi:hypothetical protein